jgi:hypothetical protein
VEVMVAAKLLSLCYCPITIAQSAGYGDVPST